MAIGDPNLIAGVGSLTVDGNQLAVKANMTISCSPLTREGIAGQDRVHGYKEMPAVPWIEADLSIQHGVSVEDMDLEVDSTVVAELADGRVFTLRDAWYVGRTEVNTQDGQYRARWEGFTCTELD